MVQVWAVGVLYPTLTIIVMTVRKWKDDGWEASKKVYYLAIGVCLTFMLVFVILAIVAYNPNSYGSSSTASTLSSDSEAHASVAITFPCSSPASICS